MAGIIGPELLRDPTVRVLAVRDEQSVTAGAIINLTGAAVGLSNVFTAMTTSAAVWRDLPAAVGGVFASVPIVGYEHGSALTEAAESGFETIAPLRVWLKPGARPCMPGHHSTWRSKSRRHGERESTTAMGGCRRTPHVAVECCAPGSGRRYVLSPAMSISATTRSGVRGSCSTRVPQSASETAFRTAAGAAIVPPSPTPR